MLSNVWGLSWRWGVIDVAFCLALDALRYSPLLYTYTYYYVRALRLSYKYYKCESMRVCVRRFATLSRPNG